MGTGIRKVLGDIGSSCGQVIPSGDPGVFEMAVGRKLILSAIIATPGTSEVTSFCRRPQVVLLVTDTRNVRRPCSGRRPSSGPSRTMRRGA